VVASGSATVRLDPFWADLAADRHAAISPTERRRLREYLTRARTFLTGLEERAATLLRVARHVAVRQHRFLREGPAAHAPLTRAEVAAASGVHASTESRAVAGYRRGSRPRDLHGDPGTHLASHRTGGPPQRWARRSPMHNLDRTMFEAHEIGHGETAEQEQEDFLGILGSLLGESGGTHETETE